MPNQTWRDLVASVEAGEFSIAPSSATTYSMPSFNLGDFTSTSITEAGEEVVRTVTRRRGRRSEPPLEFNASTTEGMAALNRLPLGTIIYGGLHNRRRKHVTEGIWRIIREDGSLRSTSGAPGTLGGVYRVEAPAPQPRDRRGRFVETRPLNPGDLVHVSDDAAYKSWSSFAVIPRDYRGKVMAVSHVGVDSEGNLYVENLDGNGCWVHRHYLRYVAEAEQPTFRLDDLVITSANPTCNGIEVVTRWANRLCRVERIRGEMVRVRSVNYPNVLIGATFDQSSLTLAVRDGEVLVVSGPETPICQNRYCGVEITDDNPEQQAEDGMGCERCTYKCDECGEVRYTAHGVSNVEDSWGRDREVCGNCSSWCDYCDRHYTGHLCPDMDEHPQPRGVIGYGHTRPTMWLGGPLPKFPNGKHNGYYLGIELEISASHDESAMPIYVWAEQHLGTREAIQCKEDSSVSGFEIVTMPMTPAVFESVNWESFFTLINDNHPIYGDEPTEHGLHVHIGRVAFNGDDVATAAYSYLLAQGDHLERIGRRAAYHYCEKVSHPVSAALVQMHDRKQTVQTRKIAGRGIYPSRGAINLQNDSTIEIRAFRSTRKADELRDAVRVTYLAADYIRYLRVNKEAVSPKSLHWGRFAEWVKEMHPEGHASIAGIDYATVGGSNKQASDLVLSGVNYDI